MTLWSTLPKLVNAVLSSFLSMDPELSRSKLRKQFCQSVTYFHREENSWKLIEPELSLSNIPATKWVFFLNNRTWRFNLCTDRLAVEHWIIKCRDHSPDSLQYHSPNTEHLCNYNYYYQYLSFPALQNSPFLTHVLTDKVPTFFLHVCTIWYLEIESLDITLIKVFVTKCNLDFQNRTVMKNENTWN